MPHPTHYVIDPQDRFALCGIQPLWATETSDQVTCHPCRKILARWEVEAKVIAEANRMAVGFGMLKTWE